MNSSFFSDCLCVKKEESKDGKENKECKESKENEISITKLLNICETGDIILYSSNTIIGNFIKSATESIYTHIGIILKNPDFKKNKKHYLYNSNSFNCNENEEEYKEEIFPKLGGVKVVDLVDNLKKSTGKIFYRKLIYKDDKNETKEQKIMKVRHKINELHNKCHTIYYDYLPNNWLGAYLAQTKYNKLSNLFSSPRHLDRMFCSAFIAYIYTQLGLLKQDTEWSFITPCFFSEINILENNYELESIKQISLL